MGDFSSLSDSGQASIGKPEWCGVASGVMGDVARLGGRAQNLSNFQMAPIPILGVLTCSTSSPHDILKVSENISSMTCPLGG